MDKTNALLHTLVEECGLTVPKLMELTGRSRTHVYGWLCPPGSKHYKKMRDKDLRLIELELGIVSPIVEEMK